MSEALDRIRLYYDEFHVSIERCRSTTTPSLDIKNAYGALGRLRDRYTIEKERNNLTPSALAALRKAFEDDTFMRSMMELRQISEHVVVRNGTRPPEISTTSNGPLIVEAVVSALPVFRAPVFNLPTADGTVHKLDHIERLETAEHRILRALAKASE